MSLSLRTAEVFWRAPRPGTIMHAYATYVAQHGTRMMSRAVVSERSDTPHEVSVRFSEDNGATWTDPVPHPLFAAQQTAGGLFRRAPSTHFIDRTSGHLVYLLLQGTLPVDDPLAGLRQWQLSYAVSQDGGRTFSPVSPLIQDGREYSVSHPFDSVWVGQNSIMIGDRTCTPIWSPHGQVLIPVQITRLGADGELYNPSGAYTYHDAAVVIGAPLADGTYRWHLSARVTNDPDRSTRGCIEPTLANLPDGRIMMVLRGSNQKRPNIPGYKWLSLSADGGYTWDPVRPWFYSTGEPFYSPSSCSQLLAHSNGRLYWIGNILDRNPDGNLPRYPLVIGEVDTTSLGLIRDSVCIIDTCRAEDSPKTFTLSNFFAQEDRLSRNINVHCTRGRPHGTFDGDAYLYQVAPGHQVN